MRKYVCGDRGLSQKSVEVRISVLGPLQITSAKADQAPPSRAVRRLIALIASAGADGISREELASELWGDSPPGSWKSAIRNRMTGARKVLGQDSILNQSGRFRFSDTVGVDSWQLIGHPLDAFDSERCELGFLEGEPLVGFEESPLLARHRTEIGDARAALVRSVVRDQGHELSSQAVQTLRRYQRKHPLDSLVTQETVRALLRAGERTQATEIVATVADLAETAPGDLPVWVTRLDDLIATETEHGPHDQPGGADAEDQQAESARAELFATAATRGQWDIAAEIAMAGLPAAERSSGDPERLRLLEAIPVDELDESRRFALCTALTRHLVYAGRDLDAQQWARTTAILAQSPREQLIARVTASLVGESVDEFITSSLIELLDSASEEVGNTQSLHIAIVSHFEQASFEEAETVRRRFTTLLENSADQSRRWHLMLLESMSAFVKGDFELAAELSNRATQFAEVFGITEAELGSLGQQANAHWVHPGFPDAPETPMRYTANEASVLTRLVTAVRSAKHDGGAAVNSFVRSFNYRSGTIWTLPVLAAVACFITDDDLVPPIVDRLRPRSGTSAILGSGVLHLGPVDRILGQLTESSDDRLDHLRKAVDVADRQRTPLWQVICRLDLAKSTEDDQYRVQARAFATTPALQQIVREYR